jgi:hypothetical protein
MTVFVAIKSGFWGMYRARFTSPVWLIDCVICTRGSVAVCAPISASPADRARECQLRHGFASPPPLLSTVTDSLTSSLVIVLFNVEVGLRFRQVNGRDLEVVVVLARGMSCQQQAVHGVVFVRRAVSRCPRG